MERGRVGLIQQIKHGGTLVQKFGWLLCVSSRFLSSGIWSVEGDRLQRGSELKVDDSECEGPRVLLFPNPSAGVHR